MMKAILLSLTLLVSANVFAKDYKISCQVSVSDERDGNQYAFEKIFTVNGKPNQKLFNSAVVGKFFGSEVTVSVNYNIEGSGKHLTSTPILGSICTGNSKVFVCTESKEGLTLYPTEANLGQVGDATNVSACQIEEVAVEAAK